MVESNNKRSQNIKCLSRCLNICYLQEQVSVPPFLRMYASLFKIFTIFQVGPPQKNPGSTPAIWVDTKTYNEPCPRPKNSPLGYQKAKNQVNIKSLNSGKHERKKFFSYMSIPKECFEPYPYPKNNSLRPQKAKKLTKNQVKIEDSIEKKLQDCA